ncbi:MAG: helix-turn-helix domain-containing protein [Pseudomonadota bacterium]
MAVKYLPIYYLGHFVEALVEHEKNAHRLITSLGLPSDLSSEVKLTTQEFERVLTRVTNDENYRDIGLKFGNRLHIAHHGTFGLAILNAVTARNIIEFVQKYISIRIPYIELSIVEDDEEIIILVHDHYWQGNSHRFIIEGMSMAMLNLFFAIKSRNNHIAISRLFFDYAEPDYLEMYRVFAPAGLSFNQAFSGMSIDKSWADNKLNGSDHLSFMQAAKLCEEEFKQFNERLTTAGQVRQLLLSDIDGIPKLSEVASKLATSSRTLHRELQREGTSFKTIIDQVHANRAKQYLLANNWPVQTVADALGYSDTANFRRAFKRWYGCSPIELKRRQSTTHSLGDE